MQNLQVGWDSGRMSMVNLGENLVGNLDLQSFFPGAHDITHISL